jgi:hypothetical protein
MKTFLVLSPYVFTEFDYFKWELKSLKKEYNYNIIIHDLSSIIANKNLNLVWKTPKYKKSKNFSSFFLWLKEFNKIKKESFDLVVYDLIDNYNFTSFLIKVTLILSGIKTLTFLGEEVASWKPNKNLYFFFKKISHNKLNHKLLIFNLKYIIFRYFFNLIKYQNLYLLTNNSKIIVHKKKYKKIIDCISQDYSNFLVYKKKVVKKKSNNYIIYLDNGTPFFSGDSYLCNTELPENNIKLFYFKLNNFFDKIEFFYKKKIIIIPHAKYKIPNIKNNNLNVYFCNRKTNNCYDALPKLITNSFFVISRGSTAISYAVVNYKPIQLIYSSSYKYIENEYNDLKIQSRALGNNLIDIDCFDHNKIDNNIIINKNKYNLYKKKYLAYRKQCNPNYKIIGDFFENL